MPKVENILISLDLSDELRSPHPPGRSSGRARQTPRLWRHHLPRLNANRPARRGRRQSGGPGGGESSRRQRGGPHRTRLAHHLCHRTGAALMSATAPDSASVPGAHRPRSALAPIPLAILCARAVKSALRHGFSGRDILRQIDCSVQSLSHVQLFETP